MAVPRYPRVCEFCQEGFVGRRKASRFCSRSCKSKWFHQNDPKFRTIAQANMAQIRSRPDVQKKIRQHLASPSNPFRNPKNQRKANEAVRLKTGFSMLNGGNGRGPTVPQKALAELLGWPTEVCVRTNQKRGSGYPTCYKIDIANPSLMIGIEVDGEGHKGTKAKARDAKKQAFLESRGWLLLRFWNHEVIRDVQSAADSVKSSISRRKQKTTSPTAS